MAGIYIHIPFCTQRCIYCDFLSGTNIGLKGRYIDALVREMGLRRGYLGDAQVRTVYFGGGTPSLLSHEDFSRIVEGLAAHWDLSAVEEWTVECNPEDITREYAEMLRSLPFNRVSIGIQSFDEGELKWLNRRHTAARGAEAVRCVQNAGFGNVSIDLMYALPMQTVESWRRTLDAALSLGVQHISAYSLMFEEGSKIAKLMEAGRIAPMDDDTAADMFSELCGRLGEAGYEQYEISNFARPGYESRHNSAYWDYTPYIGLGAGAYSFDGRRRSNNVAHTLRYCRAIEEGWPFSEEETLTRDEQYNEFVFTALRTRKGLNLALVGERFGTEARVYAEARASRFICGGQLERDGDVLRLTRNGVYVSDMVMSDFMRV
ncbi:MAG: radical SAM family heme chaperone HemW [bacterium]|uniref:Heme chaperone HemW n=1 Tax=Candidatus Aphodosoma intestinipullorum TaxID=2840674 RepID=A0A940DLJ2_9BACT|nr:radical SAM family heme chaperone HemW [Candidatus Aphodosoma intestinipullorum]